MYTIEDLDIRLTRGDSAGLELCFTGDDAPGAEDLVVLQVKKRPRDAAALLEKSANPDAEHKALLSFAPEDTQGIPFGIYCWDVRIFYADGTVVTPMAPHRFDICEVVTDDR